MTVAAIGANRRVARMNTVRRLVATPGLAAAVVGVVRVGLVAVLVGLALTGLATTCALLAGPIPEVGPQPGF